MSLKIKSTEQQTCSFCRIPFYPAPQVPNPKTCGRPGCLKEYKKTTRHQDSLRSLPLSTYHHVLGTLVQRGMEKEWFLVYVLGETGLLVSEFLRVRPVDFYFDDSPKKVLIAHSTVPVTSWIPRHYQHISARTAGVLERWASKYEIQKWSPLFPYTKRCAQKMFQRALRVAGVKESWGTRSLRHMYGLTVARATDSEETVAQALRLKDTASARIYVRISRELIEKGA